MCFATVVSRIWLRAYRALDAVLLGLWRYSRVRGPFQQHYDAASCRVVVGSACFLPRVGLGTPALLGPRWVWPVWVGWLWGTICVYVDSAWRHFLMTHDPLCMQGSGLIRPGPGWVWLVWVRGSDLGCGWIFM